VTLENNGTLRLLPLILILVATAFGEGLFPWTRGERLDYDIRYGFVTAGEASLITHPPRDSAKIEFVTLARNNGFFESVYPVKDTILTDVMRESLLPTRFRKITNEGDFHSRSSLLFDWGRNRVYSGDTVFAPNGKVKTASDTSLTLGGDFHCIISAFYKARSMSLVPGKETHIQAISGKKKYKMRIIVHGRETVEVAAGKFKCLVIEPVLEGDGLWLTDDSLRLPVLMRSKISVGSIRAELRQWSQARSP
jgi:hypothetical protein